MASNIIPITMHVSAIDMMKAMEKKDYERRQGRCILQWEADKAQRELFEVFGIKTEDGKA